MCLFIRNSDSTLPVSIRLSNSHMSHTEHFKMHDTIFFSFFSISHTTYLGTNNFVANLSTFLCLDVSVYAWSCACLYVRLRTRAGKSTRDSKRVCWFFFFLVELQVGQCGYSYMKGHMRQQESMLDFNFPCWTTDWSGCILIYTCICNIHNMYDIYDVYDICNVCNLYNIMKRVPKFRWQCQCCVAVCCSLV